MLWLWLSHLEKNHFRSFRNGREMKFEYYKHEPSCISISPESLLRMNGSLLFSQGGFEYKRAIVDCIISIVEENPESKEAGLAHLCEFIEDCEHTVLATKILHLLGKEGPRTPVPSKYIRFIFNRVVLENEAVRAGESLRH